MDKLAVRLNAIPKFGKGKQTEMMLHGRSLLLFLCLFFLGKDECLWPTEISEKYGVQSVSSARERWAPAVPASSERCCTTSSLYVSAV